MSTSVKVYVYRPCADQDECAAVAYAENGETLGWHISSSFGWAQRDMARHIPDGSEVVWVRSRSDLQALIDSGAIRGLTFDDPADRIPEEAT